MKKLMIACVAVAMAACAQAATYEWSAPYGIGDTTAVGYTAATKTYLIDSAVLSAAEIYAAVSGGSTLDAVVAGKTLGSADMAGGFFDAQSEVDLPAGYGEGDWVNAYMVLFDSAIGENGSLYFSELVEQAVFKAQDSLFDFYADSSIESALADMTNFDAATGAWVNVAGVPEPTSGLLLLLGVAGLALRRRRA